MDIYVINLARAKKRRQKMEAQAEKLGLSFQYLDATDGQQLNAEELSMVDLDRRKRVSKYPLTDNEIGCWISHRRALQLLLNSGAEMAAILEDDAGLLPGFSEVLKNLEGRGDLFDFVDLHRLFKKGEVFKTCSPLFAGFDIGRVGLMHMHATGYVMSRKGAEKFLAYSHRFAHVVDKEMHRYWANGLDAYGLNRAVLVVDDDGHSYIDETRKQDAPQERVPLSGADSFWGWLQRKFEQLRDSVQKRLAFPSYVRQGQKNWAKTRGAL